VSRLAALGWTARTDLREGIGKAYDTAPFRHRDHAAALRRPGQPAAPQESP